MKRRLFLLLWLVYCVSACGVKGDPLPPDRPAEIGRGSPTYQRATENLNMHFDEQNEDEDESRSEDERENSEEEAP